MNLKFPVPPAKLAAAALLAVIILVSIMGFWFRSFPARFGELQGLDDFYLYRLSEQLVKNGSIPAKDYLRHSPFGADTVYDNPLPFYLPASLYTGLRPLWQDLHYLEFAILFPAVMGGLAVFVIYFLGKELFNSRLAGLISAFLAAATPAFINRTGAGNFEKEGTAAPFMVLAVYFFVKAYKAEHWQRAFAYSILSGLNLLLTFWAWGGGHFFFLLLAGFMFFLVIFNQTTPKLLAAYAPAHILGVVLTNFHPTRISPTESPTALIGYGVIILMVIRLLVERRKLVKPNQLKFVVPGLIIIAVAGFFSTSLFFKPSADLLNQVLHTVVLTKSVELSTVAESQPGSWGDIAGRLSTSFANNTIPFLQSIGPYLSIWIFMFLGAVLLCYRLIRRKDWLPLLAIIWVAAAIYGTFSFIRLIFLIGVPASLVAGFGAAWIIRKAWTLRVLQIDLSKRIPQSDAVKKFEKPGLAIGLLLSTVAAFLLGILPIYLIALSVLLPVILALLSAFQLRLIHIPVLIFLFLFLLMNGATGFVYGHLEGPSICFPGNLRPGEKCVTHNPDGTLEYAPNQPWYQAFDFMRKQTPKDSNFISWWDFGYWFQTRGERPSVSDGGGVGPRYDIAIWYVDDIQNWDNYRPFLEGTYGVDYILMDFTLPGKYGAISLIASRGGRADGFPQFQNTNSYPQGDRTVQEFTAGNNVIWVPIRGSSLDGTPRFFVSQNSQLVPQGYINEICTANGYIQVGNETQTPGGCISITPYGLFYLPENLKRTIFASLMFMDGYGLPVEKAFDNSFVKIYRMKNEPSPLTKPPEPQEEQPANEAAAAQPADEATTNSSAPEPSPNAGPASTATNSTG